MRRAIILEMFGHSWFSLRRFSARLVVATLLLTGFCHASVGEEAWQQVHASDADFVFSVPGTPRVAVDRTELNGVRYRQYVLEASGTIFSVSRLVFPKGALKPEMEQHAIDVARDGLLVSSKGKLRVERWFRFEGSTAREVLVDLPASKDAAAMVARLRIYVRGDRQYTAMAIVSIGAENGPDVRRFLDSFHLAVE